MTVALPYGNITAACVDIVSSWTPLTTEFPDITVSADLVGYTQGLRWVHIVRRPTAGFQGLRLIASRGRMDVNAYAPLGSECERIAEHARLAIQSSMRGVYRGHGLTVLDVYTESEAQDLPDPATGNPRVLVSLMVQVASVV